ncbi:glycosyltransferase [Pseudomonas hunanensis]|uniref:glycosyltransferase n=1 Tax=Pseudomonas hunanensis TaxID=1247546 RepID=UPI0015BE856B|nr:glycosyltransferase [Pseudomonas hunanensis]NWL09254.1 hypothetical protein [Pseudomonas hunanensis]
MANNKRVLICAAPDLNYIDGSSIWAQTITLALAGTQSAAVDYIAKSKPDRQELFQPLHDHPHVNVIDGTEKRFWKGLPKRRLDFAQMVELATKLHDENKYDVCLIRGFEIATRLLDHPNLLNRTWVYLTDIPQSVEEYNQEQRDVIRKIATGCSRVLCQTQGFADLWKALSPDLSNEKISIYTPVINDFDTRSTPISRRPKAAIYAGKFKTQWKTLEMAQSWPKVHRKVAGSRLVVIGDKIHNDANQKDYSLRMKDALEKTPALSWLGAKSREDVFKEMQKARVGLSWRCESMDDTVEYSTKILEYGAAGCAAILNRNPLHEKLLGSDYPLFANTQAEFELQLKIALKNDQKAQLAASRLQKLASAHTFSARVEVVREWLALQPALAPEPDASLPAKAAAKTAASTAPAIRQLSQKIKVLVAGHDLKFFTSLQKMLKDTGDFEFLVDKWRGHDVHNEKASRHLLEQADVIFCEWCLGNLKWFSKHKLPHQKLIARFHAQEAKLPYLAESKWENIDQIVFVSEHTRRLALTVFNGFPIEKTSIIYNLLDDNKFSSKKKTGDAQFTLGMIGVAPMSKRLDRAIDLLENLLKVDKRYCLRIKGKHPLDYPWLLKRKEELSFYKGIFERINSQDELRHKVIFDPPGDDVNDWMSMVGYILSPSDAESFHMAVGEGILTGATPIVWNWEGADEIWPPNCIVKDAAEAAELVRKQLPDSTFKPFVLEKFSSAKTINNWLDLFSNFFENERSKKGEQQI